MKRILINIFLLSSLINVTNTFAADKPTPKEVKETMVLLSYMAFENSELIKAFSEMVENTDVEVKSYKDYINFSKIETQKAGCQLIQSAKIIDNYANNKKMHPAIATADMKKSLNMDMTAVIKMTREELDKRNFFCP